MIHVRNGLFGECLAADGAGLVLLGQHFQIAASREVVPPSKRTGTVTVHAIEVQPVVGLGALEELAFGLPCITPAAPLAAFSVPLV